MSFLNRYLLQTLILWVWLFFVPVFADESHIYGSLRRRTISSRADSLRREWRKAQGGCISSSCGFRLEACRTGLCRDGTKLSGHQPFFSGGFFHGRHQRLASGGGAA